MGNQDTSGNIKSDDIVLSEGQHRELFEMAGFTFRKPLDLWLFDERHFGGSSPNYRVFHTMPSLEKSSGYDLEASGSTEEEALGDLQNSITNLYDRYHFPSEELSDEERLHGIYLGIIMVRE